DTELVRRAFAEGRYILTRDRRLLEQWRITGALLLESEKPLDQVRELVRRFGLEPSERLFSRCLVCNTEVVPASLEEVEALVPPQIRERRESFFRCPNCARVYWEGSHTRRMRSALARIFES
ncbi:MAG: twitching motility protein PilT, partial [Gemmatimonadetes bacterium]|nr:twitching motility protein PilT [Gemmatimonadota bacterium]